MTLPTSIVEDVTLNHDDHHEEIHAKVNNFEVSGSNVGIGVTVPTKPLDVASTGATSQIKSTAAANNAHALTVYQASTGGFDNTVALNVTSDAEQSSSMYVAGVQAQRATLKITHTKPSGDDSGVGAIGIDLVGAGTAARAISIITTTATTGDGFLFRNNGRDDFVIKGTGRIGIGVASSATPSGMVDIRPYDTSTRGLFIQAFASGTSIMELRDSSSVAQLDVDNAGRIRWKLAPRWNDAGIAQTTVGAAGGASAPPATPVEYLHVIRPGGSTGVVAVYNP